MNAGDEQRGLEADDEAPAAIVVPLASLSDAALHGIIESFVLREGTDYGAVERSHAQKIADVRGQLERGEARIEFDAKTESVNLVVVKR